MVLICSMCFVCLGFSLDTTKNQIFTVSLKPSLSFLCSPWSLKLNLSICWFLAWNLLWIKNYNHSVKSVRIWSFSGPYFSALGVNTDQKNSEYGHLSRSEKPQENLACDSVTYIGCYINWLICYINWIVRSSILYLTKSAVDLNWSSSLNPPVVTGIRDP